MEFAVLIRCSLVLLVCILVNGCDSTVSFEVAPYQIRVVDKTTGQPVAGVLVVASFISHVGTHGSTAGAANVQEAVTDADGVAHFAGWLKTDLEWGFDGREPTISTFERRYQSVRSKSRSERVRVDGIVKISGIRPRLDDSLRIEACQMHDARGSAKCFRDAFDRFASGMGPVDPFMSELPVTNALIEEYMERMHEFDF